MAEINVGQISEALNNKADLDLNNTNPFADYVVEWQMPTSANDYKWYRLYKSGWLEQGSFYDSSAVASSTITLPKAYADTHYTVLITNLYNAASLKNPPHVISVSTGSFTYWSENANGDVYWQTSGIAAQS